MELKGRQAKWCKIKPWLVNLQALKEVANEHFNRSDNVAQACMV